MIVWLFRIYFIFSLFFLAVNYVDYSADTISYFQIARLYSRGEFAAALNAYWSPLLSWLMAPFLLLKVPPFVAFKLVNSIAGAALLFWGHRILKFWQCSEKTTFIAALALLAFTMEALMASFSPDFLSACLLTGVLYSFLLKKPWYQQLLLSTLLVFCKSVFLPIVLFILLLQLFPDEKAERKNTLSVGTGIIAVMAIWSSLLSLKYDAWIFNSSTRYNLDLSLKHDGYHYNSTAGLIEPAGNMLFSWQDPGYYPHDPSPVKAEKIKARIQDNLFRLAYFFPYVSTVPYLVVLIPLLAFFRTATRPEQKMLLLLATIVALCLLAYILFIPENRYFLAPQAVFILLCFYAAEKLSIRPGLAQYAVLGFLLTAFCRPLLETVLNSREQYNARMQKHQLADRISAVVTDRKLKRIASNSHGEAANVLSYVSFCTETSYYGELGYFMTPEQQKNDLNKLNIEFLCLFGNGNPELEKELMKEAEKISFGNEVEGIILNKK